MQLQYKAQVKYREDVILRLTRENDEVMKKMIDLENIIQEYEKKNEKTSNDVVNNY